MTSYMTIGQVTKYTEKDGCLYNRKGEIVYKEESGCLYNKKGDLVYREDTQECFE